MIILSVCCFLTLCVCVAMIFSVSRFNILCEGVAIIFSVSASQFNILFECVCRFELKLSVQTRFAEIPTYC